MYRIYRKKKLNSDEGGFEIFGKKWYVNEEILGLISGSLPEDQGGFTCMNLFYLYLIQMKQCSKHFEGKKK